MKNKKIIPHSKPTISIAQFLFLSKLFFSRNFSTGNTSNRLSGNLTRFFRRKYCEVLSSGTAALHLLLKSIITDPSDKILLPGYSCCDLANAVLLAGGIPVFIEASENGQISENDLLNNIDNEVKAIIIDHSFGQACLVPNLDSFGIKIIEDCTHTFKSFYKFSDIIVSLGATKLVSGVECGVVLTNQSNIIKSIQDDLSNSSNLRYPYRESDIHAGIAIKQVDEIEKYLVKRKKIAQYYFKHFSLSKKKNICLAGKPAESSSFYRFVIKMKNKDDCDACLKFCWENNIRCERPISPRKEAMKLEQVKKVYDTFLSIPIYPSLTRLECRKIVLVILKYNSIEE